MKDVIFSIAEAHQFKVKTYNSLAGGDINKVYLLQCHEGDFVVKLNSADRFPGMFETESKGLSLLSDSQSFKIPKSIATGTLNDISYLLMEYCPPGQPGPDFWEQFSHQLVQLHTSTSHRFGLDHDNYIGSLPQPNTWNPTLSEFYISQRLEPQLKMAHDQGFTFPNLGSCFQNISGELPQEQPSLIHGDLWNGNYLVSTSSYPVLIDPSVSYSSREMDLAMMQLFGGFPAEVYAGYHALFPLEKEWERRIPIWQLYYLLVHLNLFGAGYLEQVKGILQRFS